MRWQKWKQTALIVLLVAFSNVESVLAASKKEELVILRVAVASSAMESGVLQFLKKKFEEKNKNIEIQFNSSGAMQSLDSVRQGKADVSITHHESEEKRLVIQKYGALRALIFYSNYGLLGPSSALTSMSAYDDIVEVLRDLAKEEVDFLEPSEKGGTYGKIRELWVAAGVNTNWVGYENTGSSAVATMKQAAEYKTYTMAEISSYLKHKKEFKGKLELLYASGLSLRSMYAAVVVSKRKINSAQQRQAEKFVNFMISAEGQALISQYNKNIFNVSIINPAAHLDSAFLKKKTEELLKKESAQVKVLQILSLSMFILFAIVLVLFVRFRRVNLKSLEVERVADVNKKARRYAENANRAKSEFLANMSHEIRTPLTAIIGYAEILKEDDVSEEYQQESIETILNSSRHLLELINDILDLSKIEADKLAVEIISVDIIQLVDEVKTYLNMQALKKGLKVSVNHCFPLPATIKTDPVRLKQILLNICSNAVKFTEVGNVQINVSCDRDKREMRFEVIDTGIGIEEEKLSKIFEAFSQADMTITRKYGGTGLGLSLSKKLAHKLGGDIEVSSLVGVGSRFVINVNTGKLDQVEMLFKEEDAKAAGNSAKKSSDYKISKGRVLLAEDVIENQLLVEHYLKKIGLDVTIANNGLQATESIKKEEYDLVLMDLQMPVMGGIEATKILREQGFNKKIIALTANAMEEDKDACMRAGCNGFIIKPFDRDDFIKKIKEYLA